MSVKGVALSVILVIGVLYVGSQFVERGRDVPIPVDGSNLSREQGSVGEGRESGVKRDEAQNLSAAPAVNQRAGSGRVEGATKATLQIRILDEDGVALAGVTASRGDLDGVLESMAQAKSSRELASVADGLNWSTSDEMGLVEFDLASSDVRTGRVIVWMSHPGFLAQAMVFEPGDPRLHQRLDCRLLRGPTLQVVVATPGGELPAGTRILQTGLSLSDLRASDSANSWLRATGDVIPADVLQSFVRTYPCTSALSTQVSRGSIPTQLVAFASDKVSRSVITDPAQKDLTLILREGFIVRGVVHLDAGQDIPSDTRVECRWKDGLTDSFLGTATVTNEGNWGPHHLPRRETGEFLFRLVGGELVPEEKAHAAQVSGSILEVNFEGQMGRAQPFFTFENEQEPVPDAHVEFLWQVEERWQRASGWGDKAGTVLVHGCPNTTGWVRVKKPGFADVNHGEVYVVRDYTLEFELTRAGRIEGVVLHSGQPVEDFQVYTWKKSPALRVAHPFIGRKEGTFEIDGVEPGTVTLLASSPVYPESAAVVLDLDVSEPSTVVLELQDGGIGEGRVVDALTGDPLIEATVELMNQFSGRPLGGRGQVKSVGADGRFSVEGVNTRQALIKASSPGRVSSNSGGVLLSNGKIQFGTIPLAKRQDLLVRVHCEGLIPERDAWFLTMGDNAVPYVVVPPNGQLLVPDVAPGDHVASIRLMDGSASNQFLHLVSGEDWVIDFDYVADKGIDVLIIPEDGSPLPVNLTLAAHLWSSQGERILQTNVVEDVTKPTHMGHIPAGRVSLFVMGDDYLDRLGTKEITVGADRSAVIELRLGMRAIDVTAVDSKHQALDQAVVILDAVGEKNLFTQGASMRADGHFVLNAVPVDELLVTVRNQEHGLGFKRVSMHQHGTTEVEVMVGGVELEVTIRDLGLPVPGAELRLIPDGVVTDGFWAKSNEAGSLIFKGVPERGYVLSLARYGYWPITHHIDFHGQSPVELSIRRRGDIAITIQTPGGVPIGGATLSMRSLEFSEDVAGWLAARKLTSSAVQLVSDTQGACFARGIPHGTYSWTASLPGGVNASGQFEVPAGATGALDVVLGE